MDLDVRMAIRIILRHVSPAEAIQMLVSEVQIPMERGKSATEMLAYAKAIRVESEAKVSAEQAKIRLELMKKVEPFLPEMMDTLRAKISDRASRGYYYLTLVTSNFYDASDRAAVELLLLAIEKEGYKISFGSKEWTITWGQEDN